MTNNRILFQFISQSGGATVAVQIGVIIKPRKQAQILLIRRRKLRTCQSL